MRLILYAQDYVTGFHLSPDLLEFDAAGFTYDLVEDVPEIILNCPEGYAIKRISAGNYELEKLPEAVNKIEQLENESAMLALELVDTQIRLDDTERRLEQSETEQAALLLELVDKGVL